MYYLYNIVVYYLLFNDVLFLLVVGGSGNFRLVNTDVIISKADSFLSI